MAAGRRSSTASDYIVSANVGRTLQVNRQAVLGHDRRRWTGSPREGFERIGIMGTSLGSCLAMLAMAHEPRIVAGAFNHVSPYFADVVWRGLSTRHVRAGLEGHVSLDVLRDVLDADQPVAFISTAFAVGRCCSSTRGTTSRSLSIFATVHRGVHATGVSTRHDGPAVRALHDRQSALQVSRWVRADEILREETVRPSSVS